MYILVYYYKRNHMYCQKVQKYSSKFNGEIETISQSGDNQSLISQSFIEITW